MGGPAARAWCWAAVLLLLGGGCRHGAEPAVAPEVLRYSVVMQDRLVGLMATTLLGDRERETFFTYSDRARGPRLTLRFTAGAEGLPERVSVRGEDEDGNPVDEVFAGGAWTTAIDRGRQTRPGFYFPVSPVPESLAHLARALLRADGGRLPLLPEGEARLETLGEREVRSAEEGALKVRLYAVHGLQFGPSFVWLDGRGAYFASGAPYLSVIRKGFEGALPDLFRAQAEALAAHDRALAVQLAQRPVVPVVIRHARVIDVRAGVARPGMTVVIQGGWILQVAKDEEAKVPKPAVEVDAGGRSLLPGLWDLHVHPETGGELLHLAAGVVAVRDLGSDVGEALGRRKAIQSGAVLGPRLFLGGLIDGEGPNVGPTQVLVHDAADARAAVDHFAQLGFDQVKIYNSVPPELVKVIAERAHSHGLRLSGHVPSGMTAEEAVRDGLDELHHAYFLFPSLLSDRLVDHPEPLKLLVREAPWMDLDGARVRALVELFRSRHVAVDGTLALCESLYTGRRGAPSPALGSVLDRLPLVVRRRVLASGEAAVAPEQERRLRSYLGAILRLTRRLHQGGVTLLAGSDGMAGFTLHRELELLVEAGLTPAEALRIATLGAAEWMHRDREAGTIEPGKRADLLLVDGDPLVQISAIRRGARVFYDGAILEPARLYEAVSVRPLVGAYPAGDARR